ncbi:MAG: ATP-binding protein [Bacillota bacterium]|nr:ATP-binding protein [Bacillota bacterium]
MMWNDSGKCGNANFSDQLETEMLNTELWFRHLFEMLPDALILLDASNGKIADVNASACEMNGYPFEELVGQSISTNCLQTEGGTTHVMAHMTDITRQHFIVDLNEVSEVLMNENEIRQLIFNLTLNAQESMEPGGSLFLRTFMEQDQVVLCVQDNGKGISPQDMDEIGTPFFTTKEDGVGLGLPVSYSIASRHNAHISIESSSTGTKVCVIFPVPEAEI